MAPSPNTPTTKSHTSVPSTTLAATHTRRTAKENSATSAKSGRKKAQQPSSPFENDDENTLHNILNRMGKIEGEPPTIPLKNYTHIALFS